MKLLWNECIEKNLDEVFPTYSLDLNTTEGLWAALKYSVARDTPTYEELDKKPSGGLENLGNIKKS